MKNFREKARKCGIDERKFKKGRRKGEFRNFGLGLPTSILDRTAFRFAYFERM